MRSRSVVSWCGQLPALFPTRQPPGPPPSAVGSRWRARSTPDGARNRPCLQISIEPAPPRYLVGFLTPTIEAIGNIHPLRQAGGVIPTKVTSRHLEVEGWALFPDSEIARVEIAVNGVIVGRARLGLSRPDIAESHRHPSADRCGFYHFINEGELPSNPGVSAEFRVGGVALSDDGRRLEFEPLRVVRVRPSFEDRLAANRLFRHVLLLRRPLQDPSKDRDQALREEVDFWYQYLATGGRRWPEQFVQSIDPTAEVTDPILREVLSELPEEEVSILDVGAGGVDTGLKPALPVDVDGGRCGRRGRAATF